MLFFNAALQSLSMCNRYYKTVYELNSLTDEELNELNLNRIEIYNIAAEAIMK